MEEPFEKDELLIEYLLGGLPEESRAEIERRFFADDGYEELLQAVEDELIYDYVRDGLTSAQRVRFEKNFLTSAGNRERVEVARALLQRLSAKPRRRLSHTAFSSRFTNWWRKTILADGAARPVRPIYGAAALVLIVAVALLILSIANHRPGGAGDQTAQHPSTPKQTASPNPPAPSVGHPSLDSQTATQKSRPPVHGSQGSMSQLATLALTLAPGQTRDGGNTALLELSAETESINIQLQLPLKPGEQYSHYRATLLNPDEKTAWKKTGIRSRPSATGPVVLLNVPAQVLKADDYKITLSGQIDGNKYEDIADYYLSVRRR